MTVKKTGPAQMLTAADLVTVIEACATNGVVKFTFGEMEIDFSPKKAEILQTISITPEISQETQERLQKIQEDDAIAELEAIQKEQLIDNMMIDSPDEYERFIVNGELS